MDELARLVGLSRRQLERLFHDNLHCSPARYYYEAQARPRATAPYSNILSSPSSNRAVLALSVLMLVSACTATPADPALPSDESARTVLVIRHHWHTGIAVRRADIPAGAWPESGNYPDALYLEVGWGDRDFYPAPDPTAWAALRAVLAPGPSVLHVVGLRDHPTRLLPFSELVALSVDPEGFERLVDFIAATHERAGADRATPLGPGLYYDSHFYPARGSFHLFYNCNTWVVDALRAAGLPMRRAITSEDVMEQARNLGESIRPATHRETSPDP